MADVNIDELYRAQKLVDLALQEHPQILKQLNGNKSVVEVKFWHEQGQVELIIANNTTGLRFSAKGSAYDYVKGLISYELFQNEMAAVKYESN
jgi:hypothetical protein